MATEGKGRRPIIHNWKRFWFPRGELLHRFGGYLPDPHQADPYGLYSSHAPVALRWCAGHPSPRRLRYTLAELVTKIVERAWEHLDAAPGIADVFAEVALSQARQDGEIAAGHGRSELGAAMRANARHRHLLLRALLPLLVKEGVEDNELPWLVYSATPVATTDDVVWMVDLLPTLEVSEERRILVRLIAMAFNGYDAAQHEAVYNALGDEPLLADTFAWMTKGIALDSREARVARENYEREQQWLASQQDTPLLDPPPSARVRLLLDRVELGDITIWCNVTRELTLEPHSTHYPVTMEPDLTSLPGWKEADPETRARIMAAARAYVEQGDPDNTTWIATNDRPLCALAGYAALVLLQRETPGVLSTLPASIWEKWAAIILTSSADRGDQDAVHALLLKQAYTSSPTCVIADLIALIDGESKASGHGIVIHRLAACWDDTLGQALLDKAADPSLAPDYMGELLAECLDHETPGARQYIASVIAPPPPEGDLRARVIVAASVLLSYADDTTWPLVWPVML